MIVVEGTIYPLLNRLKNAGLLSYRWEESTGGPPRKYYELTDKGRLFLVELGHTWNDLQEAVIRSEEHTSELQSRPHLVCRLLLEKKKKKKKSNTNQHITKKYINTC